MNICDENIVLQKKCFPIFHKENTNDSQSEQKPGLAYAIIQSQVNIKVKTQQLDMADQLSYQQKVVSW